jgi:hypothetical protein
MRGKSTLILVVLALALGAFIYFFERHTPDSSARAERALKLFPEFNPLAVRAVTVTLTNLELRAERTPRGWRLTAPVAYPAAAPALEAFLREVGELTTRQRVTAADVRARPEGLAAYGLRPPQGALALDLATNRLEIHLGAVVADGERVYLQVAGQADVFTAGSNFVARLPRQADAWRDPVLWPLDEMNFSRLSVRAPGRGFELERDPTNRLWRLTKPIAARADQAAVEGLLQRMRGWRAAGFLSDAPAVAELEAMGLATPELELALGEGTNDVAALQLGAVVTNAGTLLYARRLPYSNVVTLPREAVEPVRVPFTALRERRLLGALPPAVEQIEIRGEDRFVVRREAGGGWRVTEPLNFAADAGVVSNLLVALAELEVAEFVKDVVTDYAPYGLAEPRRSYELRGVTNGSAGALRVDFGTNTAAGLLYARRADEPSVYAVPAGNALALPQALFELRERQLWNFAATNVVGVTVRQGGGIRRLARDAAREWIVAEGPATPFNPLSLPETLHRLGQLRAARWVARGEARQAELGFAAATPHVITLEVVAGDQVQSFTLEVAAPAPGRRWLGATRLEGETVIFELPPEVLDGVVRDLTVPAPAAALP